MPCISKQRLCGGGGEISAVDIGQAWADMCLAIWLLLLWVKMSVVSVQFSVARQQTEMQLDKAYCRGNSLLPIALLKI